MNNKRIFSIFLFVFLAVAQVSAQKKSVKTVIKTTVAGVWPAEKAKICYAQHRWLSAADYIPSTAINQLEMWQAETFDLKRSIWNQVGQMVLVLIPCVYFYTARCGNKTRRNLKRGSISF